MFGVINMFTEIKPKEYNVILFSLYEDIKMYYNDQKMRECFDSRYHAVMWGKNISYMWMHKNNAQLWKLAQEIAEWQCGNHWANVWFSNVKGKGCRKSYS